MVLGLVVPRLDVFVWEVLVPLGDFEHWIFFHFLLDPFLKSLDWQLQDLHRLDHPRSQFLGLNLTGFESERETHGLCHGRVESNTVASWPLVTLDFTPGVPRRAGLN